MSAQEQERLRIARNLHDQVDQDLTALFLGLACLESVVSDVRRQGS
ncbi:histidine kinase [Lichenifustis flavocetrariae]